MPRKSLTEDQFLWACKSRFEGFSWNKIGETLNEPGCIVRDKVVYALGLKERDDICAEQINAIKYVGIR